MPKTATSEHMQTDSQKSETPLAITPQMHVRLCRIHSRISLPTFQNVGGVFDDNPCTSLFLMKGRWRCGSSALENTTFWVAVGKLLICSVDRVFQLWACNKRISAFFYEGWTHPETLTPLHNEQTFFKLTAGFCTCVGNIPWTYGQIQSQTELILLNMELLMVQRWLTIAL